MTVLVTVLAYGLQLGALLFLPALLFFCLRSYVRKRTAVMASLLCTLLIIAAAAWLASLSDPDIGQPPRFAAAPAQSSPRCRRSK